ncbi:hypothetical protein [Brevibacterium oceani]|uniref:hypothetical protein n=1 Tax=Brevibacterium oceani TaxID=358099 RepID=UPI001B334B8D|nr:hypothetical protein [Brevibacterium oceani]
MSADIGTGSQASAASQIQLPVRMNPHITVAEALAAFQRKVPGATAEVRAVVHPFWWVPLTVRTHGLLRRSAVGRGQRMDILINAVSGRGVIADFTPTGEAGTAEEWSDLIGEVGDHRNVPSQADARRTARSLARTKVLGTVKLGMGFDISTVDHEGARRLLKPNWLVAGGNDKHTATILIDGLDASHYIVRAEKRDC